MSHFGIDEPFWDQKNLYNLSFLQHFRFWFQESDFFLQFLVDMVDGIHFALKIRIPIQEDKIVRIQRIRILSNKAIQRVTKTAGANIINDEYDIL